jgi:hypothetical protein
MWDWVIRAKRVTRLLPMLEAVLSGFGRHPAREPIPSPKEVGVNVVAGVHYS